MKSYSYYTDFLPTLPKPASQAKMLSVINYKRVKKISDRNSNLILTNVFTTRYNSELWPMIHYNYYYITKMYLWIHNSIQELLLIII